MSRKEELESMKVVDLRAYCIEHNIPHRDGAKWKTKAGLVESILQSEENNSPAETKEFDEVATLSKEEKEERHTQHVGAATVGTIIAFRKSNGKVKSAKIVKKSTKNERFMVETSYGAQYVVPYKDVIWVRIGQRWPKGIYNLLKGVVTDGKAEQN